MDQSALIAKLDAQRSRWVDLEPGKRVRVRRPLATDDFSIFRAGSPLTQMAGMAAHYVSEWDGFSEAALLGEALGSADPLPFDAEVWGRVVRDRPEWVVKVVESIKTQREEHEAAQETTEKN